MSSSCPFVFRDAGRVEWIAENSAFASAANKNHFHARNAREGLGLLHGGRESRAL